MQLLNSVVVASTLLSMASAAVLSTSSVKSTTSAKITSTVKTTSVATSVKTTSVATSVKSTTTSAKTSVTTTAKTSVTTTAKSSTTSAKTTSTSATASASSSACATAPGTYADNDTRLRFLFGQFADAVMYPANLKQVAAISSPLLSTDVQGRVDVTNTFDGAELNTAYLFGLFSNIASGQNGSTFTSPLQDYALTWETRAFLGKGDMVFGTALFHQRNQATNITYPALFDVYMLFDKCDLIKQYDVRIQRSQWWSDVVSMDYVPTVAETLNIAPENVTAEDINNVVATGAIGQICSTAQDVCQGSLQQYASISDCTTFLQDMSVGQPYELGQNTLSCRLMHTNMVRLRPSTHCPHLGKTGGGMCITRDYANVTTETYFNTPFIL